MSQSPTKFVEADEAREYLEAFRKLENMILEGGSLSGYERNCVFLNTRGPRFGNISAVSGLDFQDDSRAIGTVDWDHDGDLDVWQVNRTGPHVRFLRNDVPTQAHFLFVRLVGRTANRDGIGARLELYLKDESSGKIMRTLQAGDGYLSQSSKWVHFGLGSSKEIDRIIVKWPGGTAETFSGLKADRRYRLTQGTGKATLWTPPRREVRLVPKALDPPKPTQQARGMLGIRAPVGSLNFRDLDSQQRSLEDFRGKPVLLNLWATWCAPCIKELREFGRREQTLRQSGLEILALNVDGLQEELSASPQQARQLLARLDYPFASGSANRKLLDSLEVIRNELFIWGRPFPVPTSFLIDARGWLAAIYMGPVEVEQLLADLAEIDATPERLLAYGLPFEGRWLTPPQGPTPEKWAEVRAIHHYEFGLDLTKMGEVEEGIEQYRQALEWNPNYEDAHNNLGAIYARQGHLREAIVEYREVLRINPGHKQAHNNLGVALLNQPGELDEAITHFRESLTLDGKQAMVHESLGMALARQGKVTEAEKHFREAVRIQPDYSGAHLNLGVALVNRGEVEEALLHYRKALELKADSVDAYFRVAAILAQQGKIDEAIRHCREALQIDPDHTDALNLLALVLMTRRDVKREHIEEAVRLAERASRLTNYQQLPSLTTLTVAYEAAGRFEDAAASAERVLNLAQSGGHTQLLPEIRRRLELYRAKIRSDD